MTTRTSYINEIKIRYWDQKYPGFHSRFTEIFGSDYPSPSRISRWKISWFSSTEHKFPVYVRPGTGYSNIKKQVSDVAESVNIHPYFWDIKGVANDLSGSTQYNVLFYYDEDLIKFKLAW